jgi:hypothetical protein
LSRAPRLPLSSNDPRGTTAHDDSARRIEHRNVPRESWVASFQPCCATASKSQRTRLRKAAQEKDVGPTPWVRSLSRGGPEGHYQYPEERVPPRTSSMSRQKTKRARVATCPKAPAPASQVGVAPRAPHVPVAPAPASRLGVALGLPRVPVAPAPASRVGAAPELPRVPRTGSTSCKQLNKYPLTTQPS